jgi:hypothetical protein
VTVANWLFWKPVFHSLENAVSFADSPAATARVAMSQAFLTAGFVATTILPSAS